MKNHYILVALAIGISVMLVASVSGASVGLVKGSPQSLARQSGSTNVQTTIMSTDSVKLGSHLVYPASFSKVRLPESAAYIPKGGYYAVLGYRSSGTSYSSLISPVPQQSPGTTTLYADQNTTMGGLIIRGPEGDWVNMRENFYNPSLPIYDGYWHYHVGVIPVYWENMALPGSYTIQLVSKTTGIPYYCETVMVYPGQTTVMQAYNGGMCPMCSACI